ncbi:MAG: glycosyltransferase 87 family protein [Patescibacteria group bacterium]|nr:glycosyltransferase 87 family protein [Patescibacteria group bacterium]
MASVDHPSPAVGRVLSLEMLLLFLFGALDLVWLRGVLPVPAWTVLANAFWVVVLAGVVLDLMPRPSPPREFLKTVIVAAAIAIIVGGATAALVALRHRTGPTAYVHDNAILIEEGIKQLAAGKNFYAADYRGTALQAWQDGKFYDAATQTWFDNPALDHYITLPFYTVASLPFAWVSWQVLGWYDQRFVHLLAFGLICLAAYGLPSRGKRISLVLLALNPLQFSGLVMGTSDAFVLAFLLLSAWLMFSKHPVWAALALALACASKQTAWLFAPFLIAYWYGVRRTGGRTPRQAASDCVGQLWPLPVAFLVFVAPFWLWNARAFIDDVYRYPAGLLPTSYPIYGYGLSVLLQLLGFPSTPRGYFPYGILELALAGPLLIILLYWQRRDRGLSRALTGSGVFLLAFWWLSRFFNENYLGVVAALLMLGFVLGGEIFPPRPSVRPLDAGTRED